MERDRFYKKRDRFADLTGIRDFREICKKKNYMGKVQGQSVDDKQRWFNSRRVRRQKRKMLGMQYSHFQAVARKIRPIKWFPGQT